jgi:hypothetical protein
MQAFFFGALLIVVGSARRVAVWTPIVVALGCLHPLILVYQGIVWKDVLFANLSVFAFALLFAGRRASGSARYALAALSLACAACGALVRQNGVVVVLVLAVTIMLLETPSASLGARLGKVAAGALLASGTMLMAGGLSNALIRLSAAKAPENSYAQGLSVVMFYDIGGILAAARDTPAASLAARGLDLPAIRENAAQYYSAERMDWLLRSAPQFRPELRKLSFPELATTWSRLIVESPAAYLRHRIAVFGWMIWPPVVSKCLPLHLGMDGRSDAMAQLELPHGMRPSDKALYGYAVRFVETPFYRHGLFLILAALLAAIVVVRHGPLIAAPALALVAAALLFTLSWIVAGVACDIRYMYFLPLALLVALVMTSAIEAENSPRAPATVP